MMGRFAYKAEFEAKKSDKKTIEEPVSHEWTVAHLLVMMAGGKCKCGLVNQRRV
jgi:hypothetical protein